MKGLDIDDIVDELSENPKGVRFKRLRHVCEHYFGEARQSGSHLVYRTPWRGDPRINIQNDKGMAKAYQVRQVIKAFTRLKNEDKNKH